MSVEQTRGVPVQRGAGAPLLAQLLLTVARQALGGVQTKLVTHDAKHTSDHDVGGQGQWW